MEKQNQAQWEPIKADVKTVSWKGDPLYLKNVPAIKNVRTGLICFDPGDVAKAELDLYAEKNGITSRDIPILLMLLARPGPFQEGQIPYKYHLNKMLFYQWKNMEKKGIAETFVHDQFEADVKGPVPKNLGSDLQRLEKLGIVSLCYKKWGKGEKDGSLQIALTQKGGQIASNLAGVLPDPLKKITVDVKKDLFPLDPLQLREKVHEEYPEYQKVFTQIDRE